MANYNSPGVYIVEENAFPNTAVAVETAIPAFIGYTFKAERAGKSLIRIPTKINSFAEYVESFGGPFKPNFLVAKKGAAAVKTGADGKKGADAGTGSNAPAVVADGSTEKKIIKEFKLGDEDYTLSYDKDNELYFYNSIRLFYANGGSSCVILSVGTYGDPEGNPGDTKAIPVAAKDFNATTDYPESALDLLKNEQEPTLIVIPDIIAMGKDAYSIYTQVLAHCSAMQSRFGIFDLRNHDAAEKPDEVAKEFRTAIGTNFLNYGAAYYPWLNTGIVDVDELSFANLPGDLSTILEPEMAKIFVDYKTETIKLKAKLGMLTGLLSISNEVEAAQAKVSAAEADVTDAEGDVATKTRKADEATATVEAIDAANTDEKAEAVEIETKEKEALTIAKTTLATAKTVLKDAKAALTTAETAVQALTNPVAAEAKNDVNGEGDATKDNAKKKPADGGTSPVEPVVVVPVKTIMEVKKDLELSKIEMVNLKKNHHLALKASSPSYRILLNQARNLFNEMPPSAAMAGLYAMVDNTRGVWKSPANYSLNSVNSPTVNISSEAQENFNVDAYTGKSINVIRPFQGLGTLVWGGRTLDGNSQDWRYINVRRTLIMIEQSIKAATRAYVFEPNDANTWLTVKSMIDSFLSNLWKQGALAGAAPEQAFDVQIGLGSTMTPTDILDGKMLITIKVAIVRPAEFIVITFQQQLQQS